MYIYKAQEKRYPQQVARYNISGADNAAKWITLDIEGPAPTSCPVEDGSTSALLFFVNFFAHSNFHFVAVVVVVVLI